MNEKSVFSWETRDRRNVECSWPVTSILGNPCLSHAVQVAALLLDPVSLFPVGPPRWLLLLWSTLFPPCTSCLVVEMAQRRYRRKTTYRYHNGPVYLFCLGALKSLGCLQLGWRFLIKCCMASKPKVSQMWMTNFLKASYLATMKKTLQPRYGDTQL